MSKNIKGKETRWYSWETEHEGFALQLRYPEKPDFDSLQKLYPKLLTITHVLSRVQSSGMPESTYNKSLADFDHEVIVAFEKSLSGLTVLVETFGGRRAYYMYVSAAAPIDAMKDRFLKEYPEHELEWELEDNSDWRFIRRYSDDYNLYDKH